MADIEIEIRVDIREGAKKADLPGGERLGIVFLIAFYLLGAVGIALMFVQVVKQAIFCLPFAVLGGSLYFVVPLILVAPRIFPNFGWGRAWKIVKYLVFFGFTFLVCMSIALGFFLGPNDITLAFSIMSMLTAFYFMYILIKDKNECNFSAIFCWISIPVSLLIFLCTYNLAMEAMGFSPLIFVLGLSISCIVYFISKGILEKKGKLYEIGRDFKNIDKFFKIFYGVILGIFVLIAGLM